MRENKPNGRLRIEIKKSDDPNYKPVAKGIIWWAWIPENVHLGTVIHILKHLGLVQLLSDEERKKAHNRKMERKKKYERGESRY